MSQDERLWWARVRPRGALWFVVHKGLVFLLLYPLLGSSVLGWDWQPTLLVEGWCIGLVCGSFVWMRKELRYRITLADEGIAVPDGQGD